MTLEEIRTACVESSMRVMKKEFCENMTVISKIRSGGYHNGKHIPFALDHRSIPLRFIRSVIIAITALSSLTACERDCATNPKSHLYEVRVTNTINSSHTYYWALPDGRFEIIQYGGKSWLAFEPEHFCLTKNLLVGGATTFTVTNKW